MQTVQRRVLSLITVCLLLGPSAFPAHAQMYRWTTPNGTVAFGDRVPRTGTPANLTRMGEVPGALSIFYDESDRREPVVLEPEPAPNDDGRIETHGDLPALVDDPILPEFSLAGVDAIGINLSRAVLTGAYLAQANRMVPHSTAPICKKRICDVSTCRLPR
jgi:hypothetical protein